MYEDIGTGLAHAAMKAVEDNVSEEQFLATAGEYYRAMPDAAGAEA